MHDPSFYLAVMLSFPLLLTAVAGQVDPSEPGASLLPPVESLRASSATVAVAVAKAAADDGVATVKHDNLLPRISVEI